MSDLTPLERIDGSLSDDNQLNGSIESAPYGVPMINNIPLVGNVELSTLGLREIRYGTVDDWNSNPSLMSTEGAIYIYQDKTIISNVEYPGIKIGDGTSYLIYLPFLGADTAMTIAAHISNAVAHISSSDREKWDNKITSYIDPEDPENLILSKTNYILEGDN